MSSLERKILRNKIKQELKRTGQKRTLPLSKYRFKTDKELQEEYAARLTEQMIKEGKESMNHPASNDK